MVQHVNPSPTSPQSDLISRVPATKDATSLPKEDRADLKSISKWFRDQFERSMTQRRRIARNWVAVRSIMEGYHYYTINSYGVWSIIPPKPGEIRAVTGLMYATYRRELGRLVDNVMTVSVVPKSTKNGSAFYKADRAQIMLNSWNDEADMDMVWDEFSQHHCMWGMSALYHYEHQDTMRVEAVPAPELFPIPYYAVSDMSLDGIQRSKIVNRAWIEDHVPEAAHKISKSRSGLSETALYITEDVGQWGEYTDAALAVWIWMNPSPWAPQGFHALMIEDEIFRYRPSPYIPFEISRYDKHPSRWYGVSLCEKLIAPQKEENRQYTEIIKTSRFNKGRLFVDDETFNINDLGDSDQQIIRMSDAAYMGQRDPFKYFPPTPVGRDVDKVMGLAEMDANRAAGHESDIIRGKAEGRTESGPSIGILNTNAKAPITPCLQRMYRALRKTYPHVLDGISRLWPEEKRIATIGSEDMANEMTLGKDQRPTSEDVIIKPGPIMPMGRSEMVNLIMAMRNMPSDDQGPVITVSEFKRAMRQAGMIPPGVDSVDIKVQRITQRLDELYGDGRQPGFDPTDREFAQLEQYEDHRRSIELIKNRMLHPSFRDEQVTSPQVRKAFIDLLKLHMEFESGAAGAADDLGLEIEKQDAASQEDFLDIQAQDRTNNDGIMTLDGVPIGA